MKLKKKKAQSAFTDIRAIMDYTQETSIFFSGVEDKINRDLLYGLGIRNFLVSYEYLNPNTLSDFSKLDGIRLFVDSGAFTYITNARYGEYTYEDWEKQLFKYLDFARKNRDIIFAIADLDLHYFLGYEKIKEWRINHFEPFMLETGIPVCMIYHGEGMQEFEWQCKRYPYVGVSGNTNEWSENEYREFIAVAEKYDTVIHGMGMTSVPSLSRLPLYTADSTSWLVGAKYGEVNIFNDAGMKRIKKQDIPTKAVPVINNYYIKFDTDLIIAGDVQEMNRVNAYAFVLAEKYIRDKLRALMYWKKARIVKNDTYNLPDDFFPPPDWINGLMLDYKDYCVKFNVNPDYIYAPNFAKGITALLNWDNPDYQDWIVGYDEERISSIHNDFVNRVVPDVETKIADIQNFYWACVAGDDDTLLHLGTNFDRVIAERDNYVEDDDFESITIDKEEVKRRLSQIMALPSPDDSGKDIDELDDEIFEGIGIEPARDKHGRILAGSLKVRKSKKVYADQFPKLACNTCYAAQKCPEFKSGHACAFSKMFNRFDHRSVDDINDGLVGLVNYNFTRMQEEMVVERLTGIKNPKIDNYITTNFNLLKQLKQLNQANTGEFVQTKTITPDGVITTTNAIRNPTSGGILEKLFMQKGTSQSDYDQ